MVSQIGSRNIFRIRKKNNDPETAGPDADPDGDGVKNLLEYALGGDPRAPGAAVLPQIDHEGSMAAIIFRRNPALSDIACVVQASGDLEDWSDVLYDSREDTQANNLDNMMRVEDPVTEQRRFLRLQVMLLE